MLRGESSSNSSNASSQWTFHVFLSFRGGDTRLDFTDHLYAALTRKGIITFRDDIQLEKGDVISQELLKAIEQSLVSIVVLSKNYASSTWCLDELQKILESRRLLGREVIPVFYGVTPSDVGEFREGFAEAVQKHETRFEEERMQKWRDSLIEVAGIPGWESKDKHDVELIENIVASVWKKIRPKLPSYNDGLVGIESRVRKMESLLTMESNQVRFIGIWGMGGIGKTTLARFIFNKLHEEYQISCFLENVREISGEKDGILSLQRKILSQLEIKGLEIKDVDDGKNTIRNLLLTMKVLIVIDDVDDISQLECLAERPDWFGRGSRVIVTTRDAQVLISHGIAENYEMDKLNQYESLQLLSQKAFKRDQPHEKYMDLSKRVVHHAAGLPLALKLLGAFLCGRSESQWKEVVEKIMEVPPNDIVKKSLRISYNGLPVSYQILFLDIACFFKGGVKELVMQALEICERYPPIGIDVLIEKSLASYDGMNLGMHDLLQEAGRDIVVEECPIDASRRSRLWSLEDIDYMLRLNKGTESIQGLILNSQTKPYEASWDPEAFSKMCNLKLVIIGHDIQLPRGLKCLCSSLKFLQWNNYPLEALPLGVPLDEVVELKLFYSKIKKIWSGIQSFAKLRFIDLSHSKDLFQTPVVYGVPCLEILHLNGCINLVEVHQSIAQHKRLVLLNLKGCINLQTLPKKLEMDSLEKLILSGCTKVKKLPEFGHTMKCLSQLSLENCINLLCLPNSICNLKSLRSLNISGCTKFSSLPNNMDANESLEELNVSGTAIKNITKSKVHLEKLKVLFFGGSKTDVTNSSWKLLQRVMKLRRQQAPMEITLLPLSQFSALVSLDLSYRNLDDELFSKGLGNLSLLQDLDLRGNNLVNPPVHCISNLSMLQSLSFSDCQRLESLPMIPPKVISLFAADCAKMRPLDLEAQMLWQIFEYQMHMELIEDDREVWFIIPGSEIPSWFENQSYNLIIDPPSHPPYNNLGCDSVASIIVDVPNYCKMSEWWGIAVCLAFEPINMHVSSVSDLRPSSKVNEGMCLYYWACKAPNREPDMGFPIGPKYGYEVPLSSDPYIHVIFLTREHMYIQHYLEGDQSQLELIFYVENHSKPWKPTIRKCGCRVVCKEDFENWHNVESSDESEVKGATTSSNTHSLA